MVLLEFSAYAGSSSSELDDGFLFTPSLAIGVPHPVDLTLDLRLPDHNFAVGIAGGTLTIPLQNSINIGVDNFDLRMQWHPWAGSLFLGTNIGTQTLHGSSLQQIQITPTTTVPTKIDLSIRSTTLTPHLGWLWIYRAFSMGFELGWQVPLNPSSSFDITLTDPTQAAFLAPVQATAQYQKAVSDIDTLANRIGKIGLPYTVLRFGWTF